MCSLSIDIPFVLFLKPGKNRLMIFWEQERGWSCVFKEQSSNAIFLIRFLPLADKPRTYIENITNNGVKVAFYRHLYGNCPFIFARIALFCEKRFNIVDIFCQGTPP